LRDFVTKCFILVRRSPCCSPSPCRSPSPSWNR